MNESSGFGTPMGFIEGVERCMHNQSVVPARQLPPAAFALSEYQRCLMKNSWSSSKADIRTPCRHCLIAFTGLS